ncbi:hypothetical protein CYLTODRAFT_231303 [Cylindrobasidium torrendii FP15055 ss-10]|uniref:Uncharacterized protein n=1 Tax=Cylindrobasidium torrendii FP15055 ss-10 TaxID=1314674 RepID=A0A0D7BGR7_9AGAR|nr:hypothetical protein CYLTODRAFT_231303 [Cylindrobasidium torrendii FP15055 ss-10]
MKASASASASLLCLSSPEAQSKQNRGSSDEQCPRRRTVMHTLFLWTGVDAVRAMEERNLQVNTDGHECDCHPGLPTGLARSQHFERFPYGTGALSVQVTPLVCHW